MAFPKINDRYTCAACTLYDSEAAAEDKEDHIGRAQEHTIYFCPVCKKTSCTSETLSGHFDDQDSEQRCRGFRTLDILTIEASSQVQMLKTSNAPAPRMILHREVVTAADYLVKQREALLCLHPELKKSLPIPKKH